jgi:D-alanine-D-alanine ligase-like ATP-grasp enzyme
MMKLMFHPLVLRVLQTIAMGKAFLRYRNPRRRAVGREHVAFYDEVWRRAAGEIGAECISLGKGISEISLADSHTRVVENVTEIDDPVTLAVLHDKPLTHRILSHHALPVPRHAVFSAGNVWPAAEFMQKSGRECVVKPASGTGGGRGVTTGIRTSWQLARAAAHAAVYGDDLMIEEQIEGDNYRLLYLDGELIDAFVRRLPSVVGDGRSTVRQLVDRLNKERANRGVGLSQVLLTVDLDMKRTLAKQRLSLRSVPSAGTKVTLKTVVNENSGADNSTATHLLCDSIVEDGRRAAAALRARFIGIDIVTADPSRPLEECGGVFLEINGTPNLYYHYHKQDGSFPVARHLLDRLLRSESQPDSRDRELLVANEL